MKSTKEIIEIYQENCKPEIVSLLKAVDLDLVYNKAKDDYLWADKNGESQKILDLAGGYGANLFGHNNTQLKQRIIELYNNDTPFLAQGSCRAGAALLAQKLNNYTTGEYLAIFSNTGTETVEAAIKHAYYKYNKPYFLSIKGGFHGLTLGSIQLTSSYREPFNNMGFDVHLLDLNDSSTWKAAEQIMEQVSGLIFEPILGEGGGIGLPQKFIQWVKEQRVKHEFSLIADEVQTGMGRTGHFFASQMHDIQPDCYCLSKSLGGGLVKIGALLINMEHYAQDFAVIHASTFAEDDISCFIGLRALEVLEEDRLMKKCEEMGAYFKDKLNKLEKQYPNIIKEVRGEGLLLCVEIKEMINSNSNLLDLLSSQQHLSYAIASVLMSKFNIRVAPTLSQSHTIRLAPSAYITKEAINSFINAFTEICEALHKEDFVSLIAANNTLDSSQIKKVKAVRQKSTTKKKIGFIAHIIHPEHAKLWDPTLAHLSNKEIDGYLKKLSPVINPQLSEQVLVKSNLDEVQLNFYGLMTPSSQIEEAMLTDNTSWIVKKIENAVQQAKADGCQVMGFGGYTSILTRNCTLVETEGIKLTSGNSLTVGMGLLAIEKSAKEKGIELKDSCLGIVGAMGNISSVYAEIMAPKVKEVVLIVRDLSSPKVAALVDQLTTEAPYTTIRVSDKMEELKRCSLILSASNSRNAIIYPKHLNDKPVVICDIALPFDVSEDVKAKRKDVHVIQGGVVELPKCDENKSFRIGGMPLELGTTFACMSETLLMGLDDTDYSGSVGKINAEQVHGILEMAENHGFELGSFKTGRSY